MSWAATPDSPGDPGQRHSGPSRRPQRPAYETGERLIALDHVSQELLGEHHEIHASPMILSTLPELFCVW